MEGGLHSVEPVSHLDFRKHVDAHRGTQVIFDRDLFESQSLSEKVRVITQPIGYLLG